MELSQEELLKTQGTRLDETPPWMTYNQSLEEELNEELQHEVTKYSEQHHVKTSSQNQEELARQKEQSDEVAKEYQFLSPEEYKDEAPRIGRVLHSSSFINKLRKECNVSCWYRQHPLKGKVTLIVKQEGTEPEVGCWVQEGFMPEFSIVRFDTHGVPLDEKYRGWRTCLLQLILKGVLTEELAHKVFGKAEGPASGRYNSTLYEFRNNYIATQ